jgi:methylenetetrahydrofolate reductase (NADPH)
MAESSIREQVSQITSLREQRSFFDMLRLASAPLCSFEFFPPKKDDAILDTTVLMCSMEAEHNPDFVTITYGAGGGTRERSLKLLRYAREQFSIPVVAHLTCTGHTKTEIDTILDLFSELGIRHILALRGDPPKDSHRFVPEAEGFSCARDLVAHIARRGGFSVAVAAYPEGHKEARSSAEEFNYLREKIEAGAELVLTQLFFDNNFFESFLEKLARHNITTPVIPGVMPIRNLESVERFTALCGASLPDSLKAQLSSFRDQESLRQYGVEFAARQCEGLLQLGVPGIHFYTLNKSAAVAEVIRRVAPTVVRKN